MLITTATVPTGALWLIRPAMVLPIHHGTAIRTTAPAVVPTIVAVHCGGYFQVAATTTTATITRHPHLHQEVISLLLLPLPAAIHPAAVAATVVAVAAAAAEAAVVVV